MAGVFNCLDHDIPHNAGSFSRVTVKLREGCITGIPKFPHSCSMATTNIADRIVNITQSAFADIGDGYGLAEGAMGMGAGAAVISGHDWRRDGPYINQEWVLVNGGPGTPTTDGWLNYGLPVAGGLMYRGSVEVDESKYPLIFKSIRVIAGGGGAGRFRGSPGAEVVYGPRKDPMTIVVSCDAQVNPPQGVRGGEAGPPGSTYKIHSDGQEEKLPGVIEFELEAGEWVRGVDSGGGGYGRALERDPQRVLKDVIERWETEARANDVYGVIFTGSIADGSMAVDLEATKQRRAELA
jgi:N-methylhydantoinase B